MRIFLVIMAVVAAAIPARAPAQVTRPAEAPLILQQPLRLEVTGKRTPARGPRDQTLSSETMQIDTGAGGQASLAEVVESSAAVHTRNNGANANGEQISIRGAGARHTEAYLQGVPLDGGSGRGYQMLVLPAPMLHSVELYEGANPFGYGSSPIGGALHINLPRPDRSMHKAWLGTGSYRTADAGVFSANAFGDNLLSTAAALGGTRGDFSYRDDNGTVTNLGDDTTRRRANNWRESAHGLLQFSHRGVSDTTRFMAMYSGSRGGVAGSGTRQRTHASYQRHQLLGGLDYTRELAHTIMHRFQLSSFYNLYQDQLHDPRAEFGSISRDSHDLSHLAGARYKLGLRASRYVQIDQHTEWRMERYLPQDIQDKERGASDSQRTLLQPGLQVSVEPATPLTVVQSVAWQHVRNQISQADGFGRWVIPESTRSENYPVYRAGMRLQLLEGATLRANYVQAHRIPSFTELFGDGLYVVPNGTLQPEQARTADAGLRYQWLDATGQQWFFAKLGGHYTHIDHIIQFVRSSADTFKAVNLDAARIWGITTAAGFDILDHLQASLNHQYLATEQISPSASRDGKILPMRPQSSWYGQLLAYTGLDTPRAWLSRLEVGARVRTESGTFLDPANLIHIPARYSLDSSAGAFLFRKRLRLHFEARNLTNQLFLDRAGFPQPGRNYYAIMEYHAKP